MDEERIKYLSDNQEKWRTEYYDQKKLKKSIMKVLGRQYSSKCNVPKDNIKATLSYTFDIPLMCIKENNDGFLYITYA